METNGLLLRLKERKPFASSAERNVIEYVQGNPRAVLSMTIRELADETFTSPSTIVRLCRKLGCDGYKQFQREIVLESATLREHGDMALEEISASDSAAEIIRKVVQSDVRSIEATRRVLDAATLEPAQRLSCPAGWWASLE